MRLSLRFIIPLVLVLAAFAWAMVPLVDELTLRWFMRDLDLRATLVANALREPLQDVIQTDNRNRMLRFFTRITEDERLFAMGFCASPESRVVKTPALPDEIGCAGIDTVSQSGGRLVRSARGPLLVSVRPLVTEAAPAGRLIFVHDMSFVQSRSEETRTYLFYLFVGLGLTISLITVAVAQLSWRGWLQGLRALLRGEGLLRPQDFPQSPELRPIASDLRALIRDIVASNREPYIHVRQGELIVVRRPASGLVTALEPVMRACSGTWVAHGGGSADREVVDGFDRVAVPGEHPAYQLRRVWLTPEEEAGYYYGFANEGLWPLCHIAHVRPTFRSSDWEQYVKANRRFARAVLQEARASDPIVLVQDYHFALLPRMIQEALPGATIVTFWHIPWPNPEAFGICPWREDVLDGLLGSSILGFHTQFHCNNFVDTVDRLLEARTDREMFTVSYRRKLTAVQRYPISIDWPPALPAAGRSVEQCRADVRRRHGLPPDHAVGLGVDRLDYTKGIEERLRAVERLLEIHPEWVGNFTFIQIAAPTRGRIAQYQEYAEHVRVTATAINERFGDARCPPIVLRAEHHEPEDVYDYYRATDCCFVSSLHDGMNLVAKEFIAARDDERGVLILSQFTGAARELPEAIIVNPYDTDQCAAALHVALGMPGAEQGARMRVMRGLIQEFNVYRWAGRMLLDAARMRRRGRLLERAASPDPAPRGEDAY